MEYPMRRREPTRRTPIKYRRKKVPQEIRDHWQRVADIGCAVTGSSLATIHHVHGGSITARWGKMVMPGGGQKQNDWLVIPLHPEYHTGNQGIDSGMGVVTWEIAFGHQVDMLDAVRAQILERFKYDIYEKAGLNAT